jgi:hypothetical protein
MAPQRDSQPSQCLSVGTGSPGKLPYSGRDPGFLVEEHNSTMKLLENFYVDDWEKAYHCPDSFLYQPSWIFWHVLEHKTHHRGELSMILGLLSRSGLDL